MTERLAACHLGHNSATSTSVERGPSRDAAIDQRVSPDFTTTPDSSGGIPCLIGDRLRSPGSARGGWGFHRGSREFALAMDPVFCKSGADPAAGLGVQAGCGEVRLLTAVGPQPGSGRGADAWAIVAPRRFKLRTAAAIRSIKAGLNFARALALAFFPLRCKSDAKNASTNERIHHATSAAPAPFAMKPIRSSMEMTWLW